MAVKVLLVGGGITSAATGFLLRRAAGNRVHLVLWDKARREGGRMSTSYSRSNEQCTADLGAQYFTSSPDKFSKNRWVAQRENVLFDKALIFFLYFRSIYESLLQEGLIEDMAIDKVEGRRGNWPEGTKNFVAPKGSGSIVSHFIEQSKLDQINFQHHVSSITTTPDGIEVRCKYDLRCCVCVRKIGTKQKKKEKKLFFVVQYF